MPPADQAVRARVTSDFDTTFLVEAGAGTGKTTVLVKRILALVRSGRATIDRIVAITFTEKAAGELKLRLREEIETGITEAQGEEAERLKTAAADLERAPVSTIHAFGAALLRERPFEAGLDPGFEVAAEVASDRTFDDAWDAWLDERMRAADPVLVRAMACGLNLKDLRQAAQRMTSERDILGRETEEPAFGTDALLDRIRQAVETLEPLKKSCQDTSDDAYRSVLDLEADLARAERLDPTTREVFLRDLYVQAHKGRQTSWDPKEACKATKAELKAVKDAHKSWKEAGDAQLAWALRGRLRGFLETYEEAKQERAVVDFQDLLLRTRDVLMRSVPVRRYFQRRFDFILVDEFQDTDPLQVEIAVLLAEDPEQEPAADWCGVCLQPGKLFVVGDPKQSIYRFRRADIAVYEQAKKLIEDSGGEVLPLTTNFRTVPSVLAFTNEFFEDVFSDPERDPKPRALDPYRSEVDGHGARTVALAVPPERLPEDGDRKVDTVGPLIAETIAAFLEEITRTRPWSIRDGDSVRPVRPGDVALLVRRMTPGFIDPFEAALTAHGVPYRLVGGKEYFARDEVQALTAVLRAIDNPADRLAVFTALRSPFFGFSDADLWPLVASGGTLNYLAPLPDDARNRDLLAPAWEALTRLHRLRRIAPPSDVLMALFQRTRALAGFRLRRGGDQALANLWKTVDLARAYEAAGPATLRTVVRFLEEERRAGTDEGDSPVGEQAGAQVEVVTVHRAKGLEYPIVVLGDILYSQHRAEGSIVHHATGEGWLQVGSLKPAGWEDAREKEKLQEEAEERRLLYVALTRARDHLVIPCLPDGPRKGWALPALQALLPPGEAVPFGARATAMREGGTKRGTAELTFFDSPRLNFDTAATERADTASAVRGGEAEVVTARTAEEAWKDAQRARRAAGRDGRSAQAVSADAEGVEGRADDARTGREETAASQVEDHAAAFGRLVHALLALPEPLTGEALRQAAQAQRLAYGLSETEAAEAADLAERAQTLPAVAAARTAEAVYREVPFTCRMNGELVTGRIDLAYRIDGAWTVIDLKTARLADSAQAARQYREQMGRYRAALASLTGQPVAAALCLVRTGQLVPA
jgi:ATP-dependent helicase/nuclease subunit A